MTENGPHSIPDAVVAAVLEGMPPDVTADQVRDALHSILSTGKTDNDH